MVTRWEQWKGAREASVKENKERDAKTARKRPRETTPHPHPLPVYLLKSKTSVPFFHSFHPFVCALLLLLYVAAEPFSLWLLSAWCSGAPISRDRAERIWVDLCYHLEESAMVASHHNSAVRETNHQSSSSIDWDTSDGNDYLISRCCCFLAERCNIWPPILNSALFSTFEKQTFFFLSQDVTHAFFSPRPSKPPGRDRECGGFRQIRASVSKLPAGREISTHHPNFWASTSSTWKKQKNPWTLLPPPPWINNPRKGEYMI